MSRFALLFLLTLPLIAQTEPPPTPPPPPDPPACLTAPVTKGTVTLSCSMIDSSAWGQQSDLLTAFANQPLGYLFLLKVASSDPDVVAVRFEVTYVSGLSKSGSPVVTSPVVSSRAVVAQRVNGVFAYTLVIPPVFDGSPIPVALDVRSINIQELRPANSQLF
jgi:hypothetical protein